MEVWSTGAGPTTRFIKNVRDPKRPSAAEMLQLLRKLIVLHRGAYSYSRLLPNLHGSRDYVLPRKLRLLSWKLTEDSMEAGFNYMKW